MVFHMLHATPVTCLIFIMAQEENSPGLAAAQKKVAYKIGIMKAQNIIIVSMFEV